MALGTSSSMLCERERRQGKPNSPTRNAPARQQQRPRGRTMRKMAIKTSVNASRPCCDIVSRRRERRGGERSLEMSSEVGLHAVVAQRAELQSLDEIGFAKCDARPSLIYVGVVEWRRVNAYGRGRRSKTTVKCHHSDAQLHSRLLPTMHSDN